MNYKTGWYVARKRKGEFDSDQQSPSKKKKRVFAWRESKGKETQRKV